MKKRIIGISGSQFNAEGAVRDYVSSYYSECVGEIGAIPLILPITENPELIEDYVDLIDGLILSGGHDISPGYYNEELLNKGGVPFKKRDRFDMALLEEAVKKNIPVLGICRGMQLINVYFGGSLYQDLKYFEGVELKHWQDDCPEEPVHKVFLSKDTVLREIFDDEIWVNSFHHQVVKEVGRGLKVGGTSSDRCIEVIERVDEDNFILGIQWHPEIMCANGSEEMRKVFQLFYHKTKK